MLPFFLSTREKHLPWTRNIVGYWKQHIMPWKMVCILLNIGEDSNELTRALAGIPIENCVGSDTSVYTGCFTNDWSTVIQDDIHEKEQRHGAVGIATTMLANRLSWFFNLKGTSMNIDSACSSSLVALHLACKDVLSGASSMVGSYLPLNFQC